jgi:hypothetical protein
MPKATNRVNMLNKVKSRLAGKKVLLLAVIACWSFAATAQSEKFQKAMGANLAKYETAQTALDFQTLSANFERIANAEKNQWLAFYYAAHAQIVYGFMQQETAGNDALADKAEQFLAKADSLQPNNSEIACLKSMAATLHMLVNPMQRYMQYAEQINGNLEKAKQQDPTNPRPYYLQGQNLKGTPPQFGGGCKTAKPILEQGVKLYETFKPASSLHPNWGKAQTEGLLAECNK